MPSRPPPGSEPPSQAPPRLDLCLLVLLNFALRFPMLHVALERDEGGYAYSAWAWAKGALPYRDAFDNKPPLLLLIYRAAQAFFGANGEAAHLAMVAAAAAAALLVYAVARRELDLIPAWCAAAAFSLMAAEPGAGVGNAANSEVFMVVPLAAAAWFLPLSSLLCGVCLGAAAMCKQTAVFEAAAFAALILLRRRSPREVLRLAAGAAVVPAAFGLYFWTRGGGREFLDCVFLYNLSYGSQVAREGRLLQGLTELGWTLKELARPEAVLWALALAGAGYAAKRRQGAWVLLWLAASAAGVSAGLRFLPHYFVQAAPAAGLLAGFGAQALIRAFPGREAAAACALAAAVLLPYGAANAFALVPTSPEEVSRRLYEGNAFVEAKELAAYLREHSGPEDRVYVFGSEPQILFYAERPSATRYIHFVPLLVDGPRAQAMQAEAIAQVEAAQPPFLVWVNNPLSFMAGPKSRTEVLHDALARVAGYEPEAVVLPPGGAGSPYLFGRDKVKMLSPEQVRTAPLILYRRKPAGG